MMMAGQTNTTNKLKRGIRQAHALHDRTRLLGTDPVSEKPPCRLVEHLTVVLFRVMRPPIIAEHLLRAHGMLETYDSATKPYI